MRRQRDARDLVPGDVEDQVDSQPGGRQSGQCVLRRHAEQVGHDDSGQRQVDDDRLGRRHRHVEHLVLEAVGLDEDAPVAGADADQLVARRVAEERHRRDRVAARERDGDDLRAARRGARPP